MYVYNIYKAAVDHIHVDWIFWLHEVFDSWPSRWRYRFTSSPPLPDAPWRETRAVRSVYVIKGTRVSRRRRRANKRTAYNTRPAFCVYTYMLMRSCCNSDRSGKGKKRRGNRFSGVVFYLFIILFFFLFLRLRRRLRRLRRRRRRSSIRVRACASTIYRAVVPTPTPVCSRIL